MDEVSHIVDLPIDAVLIVPDYEGAVADESRPNCFFMVKEGEPENIVHVVSVPFMLAAGWAIKRKD